MSTSKKNTSLASWFFFGFVFICYSIAFITNSEKTFIALKNAGNIFIKMLPVIGLMFILLMLTFIFLSKKHITKNLGKTSGIKGWAIAIFGGILSTGPVYAWYPLLSELQKKGMKTHLIATFIYARGIKLFLLPIMIFYFGWIYTSIFVILLLLFSIVIGISMKCH